ncbi:hypothetical membrane protein [Corynebacterium matruchotii]|uniref:DUF350 domain-containing protein n=1 Tax=Corynebacterium matruchotii TaxID=43768 RepID=UPI000F6D5C3D|nr:DUF350 domain-containing protein [Corynebacterium matruchotii]VEI98036.1 hypothetical membrane protein [Corynebacterium matruchotii]
MHHILLAAQPTALLTEVPTPDQPLGQGVISTLAYFVLSMTIFGIGFIVQDLLTPGKFRKQVFVDNLPNACVLAGSQAIAIGIVLAAAISTSPTDLVAGLIATAVYGTVGLALQTIFLVLLEWLNPEKFRYVVEDTKLRPSVLLSGIILIVVGVINAACLL